MTSKYGALRREIEEMLTINQNIIPEIIPQLRQKIDRLAEDAPQLPDSIWSKRQEVLKEDADRSLGLG